MLTICRGVLYFKRSWYCWAGRFIFDNGNGIFINNLLLKVTLPDFLWSFRLQVGVFINGWRTNSLESLSFWTVSMITGLTTSATEGHTIWLNLSHDFLFYIKHDTSAYLTNVSSDIRRKFIVQQISADTHLLVNWFARWWKYKDTGLHTYWQYWF